MTPEQPCSWHRHDADELALVAARDLMELAEQAIARRGLFHLVLAGGRTPEALYRQLATMTADWDRWWIHFGDERCLPLGDPGRNDTMARQAWLDRVSLPARQVMTMPAELGPDRGAALYAQQLADLGLFDLVLLGLGEDGHTASLFPGQATAETSEPTVAVHHAPKPPAQRVSLSASRLSSARQVWFLITGEDKRPALEQWQRGVDLPAAWIRPPSGIRLYTDLR